MKAGCSSEKVVFSEEPKPVTDDLRLHIRGLPSEKLTHYVNFDDASLWSKPLPAEQAVQKLSFIRKKEKWQFYFRGSVRQIPEQDFTLKGMLQLQP